MKKLIILILSLTILCYLYSQDPQLSSPVVDPSPALMQFDATTMCVTLENNSSTPIPYNGNNPVIVTISIARFIPNQSTLSGVGLAYYTWSWSCNGCEDGDLKNDVWTLRGVQNTMIPGRADIDDVVGGAICWQGSAIETNESEQTSSFGVGFNSNIAATVTRDLNRMNDSNNQSIYTFTNIALPVELIDFQVKKFGRFAQLKWHTGSEVKSSHFEVERSADGRTFTKIGEVVSAGTTSTSQKYEFTDVEAGKIGGLLYYRLQQIDQDGTSVYSRVESLDLRKGQGLSLETIIEGKIYEIRNSQGNKGIDIVKLYDINGRVLWLQSYNNENNVRLNFQNFNTALYTLVVNRGELTKRVFIRQ